MHLDPHRDLSQRPLHVEEASKSWSSYSYAPIKISFNSRNCLPTVDAAIWTVSLRAGRLARLSSAAVEVKVTMSYSGVTERARSHILLSRIRNAPPGS